jgi:hypothetical protein
MIKTRQYIECSGCFATQDIPDATRIPDTWAAISPPKKSALISNYESKHLCPTCWEIAASAIWVSESRALVVGRLI